MDQDFGPEEDGPFFSWLPPDDRLWRHPSEVQPTSSSESSSAPPAGSVEGQRWDARPGLGALRVLNSPTSRLWMVALFAGAVGALAASGVGIMSGAFTQTTTVIRPIISSTPVSLTNSGAPIGSVDWTTVDDEVAPSVVEITVSGADGSASGSGLLLFGGGGNGYVITDQSLFSGSEATASTVAVQVMFLAGNTVKGRLIDEDPLSGLALIEVSDDQIMVPTLGSVADLQEAEPVMAVGARTAPGGSVYTGSVSAEDRTVDLSQGADMDNLIAVSTTTMTAAVTGGPLLDQYGRVVGITVDVDPTDTSETGLTFAVPIDEAKRVAEEMVDGETVDHPWLGVTNSQDVPSSVARQIGVTGGSQAGAVWPDSPAGRVGIQPGDIITSFDGQPVASTGSLMSMLYGCQPGHLAPISFFHDGRSINAEVLVTDEPADS